MVESEKTKMAHKNVNHLPAGNKMNNDLPGEER